MPCGGMFLANGYHGPQLHDHGEKRARALIRAGLEHFKIDAKKLKETPKGDWRKGLLAAMIQAETTMKLDWIGAQLNMGTRSGTCRLAAEARKRLKSDRNMQRNRDAILKISILNGPFTDPFTPSEEIMSRPMDEEDVVAQFARLRAQLAET